MANAMKRVAAAAHLSTPWLSEPAKCPGDRVDYCLECSFRPQCKHQVLVFTLEWSGARPLSEKGWGLVPMSIPSELGHVNFFA